MRILKRRQKPTNKISELGAPGLHGGDGRIACPIPWGRVIAVVSELGVPELHGGDGHIACPMLGTLHADAPFACNTT